MKNLLKDLNKESDTMSKQVWNLSREMETTKLNQMEILELKWTKCEGKNLLVRFNDILDIKDETKSELKNYLVFKKKKKRSRLSKNKQSHRDSGAAPSGLCTCEWSSERREEKTEN